MLQRWVLEERCRVVALLGMGGIGKTTLAAGLARELTPAFERVYWRSVRNAPTLVDWLGGAIGFLSGPPHLPSGPESVRMRELLELLRTQRCLLVLDNLETHLQPGLSESEYREGYASYGRAVLEAVANFAAGDRAPEPLDYRRPEVNGMRRPAVRQVDRRIDWTRDSTAEIARTIRAADSSPGVLDTLLGQELYLLGAHEEDRLRGPAGQVLGQRHGALCLGTVDGAIWITDLKTRHSGGHGAGIKLPAAQVLGQGQQMIDQDPRRRALLDNAARQRIPTETALLAVTCPRSRVPVGVGARDLGGAH